MFHIDKLKAYEGEPPTSWLLPHMTKEKDEEVHGSDQIATIPEIVGSLDETSVRPKRNIRQPARLGDYIC